MRFEFIVASRYLRAKRKQAVVSLITIISIVGVAAGVAALVIALSINAGFQQDLQEKLLGAQAHITLIRPSGEGIAGYRELIRTVEQVPGVVAASPSLYQGALLDNGFRERPSWIKGIVPELEARRSEGFSASLIEGDLARFDARAILIGEELARSLGSFVGDEIRVISAEGRLTPMGMAPRSAILTVAGIFRSGLYDFDAGYAYIPLEAAQRLANAGDAAGSIEIEIADIDRSDVLGPEILRAVGDGFEFTDWKTQNTAIFQALKLERLVMFITIGLIVIVASLNIVATLVMMVMEKTRDIAILMSMGATRENIRRIFVAQGVIIGVVGTVIGLAAGNLLSYVADAYRLISLAPDVYSIDHVPFEPSVVDSIVVGAAAVLISYLATLYPSRAAAGLHPAEAIRYE